MPATAVSFSQIYFPFTSLLTLVDILQVLLRTKADLHFTSTSRSYLNTEPAKTTYKTNQNDPKPGTMYPNTTGLRDICVDGHL